MRCPKCGQETSGNYCNNCGASLMKEDHLLEEDLAESLKDLFEDMDSQEPKVEIYDRGERRPAKKAEEAPLRAPRSRKDPKEQKKSSSEKKEKTTRTEKKKEEAVRSRKADQPDRRNKYRNRENIEEQYVSRRRDAENRHREGGEHAELGESAFQTAKNAAVKGAVGTIVLSSRVMQIISALLMAAMVAKMVPVFINYGSGLGLIDTMLTDNNFSLILYVGTAGFCLFMGAVWCLWSLSKKSGGGDIRLKKYDVGRGFIPFLICLGAVFAAGFAAPWIPAEAESLGGFAGGINAFLAAVNGQSGFLFSCSVAGAVLSFIRKLLRV